MKSPYEKILSTSQNKYSWKLSFWTEEHLENCPQKQQQMFLFFNNVRVPPAPFENSAKEHPLCNPLDPTLPSFLRSQLCCHDQVLRWQLLSTTCQKLFLADKASNYRWPPWQMPRSILITYHEWHFSAPKQWHKLPCEDASLLQLMICVSNDASPDHGAPVEDATWLLTHTHISAFVHMLNSLAWAAMSLKGF